MSTLLRLLWHYCPELEFWFELRFNCVNVLTFSGFVDEVCQLLFVSLHHSDPSRIQVRAFLEDKLHSALVCLGVPDSKRRSDPNYLKGTRHSMVYGLTLATLR